MPAKTVIFLAAAIAGFCFPGAALAQAPNGGVNCFTFRGKLEVGAAAPHVRITRIATKDVWGVPDGPPGHEQDGLPEEIRKLMRPDGQTVVFGDYNVCPLRAAKKGQMQMVRIQTVTVVAVMNPQKPG